MTLQAFTGGPILTMDPARPAAEVVVVRGDRILAVGGRDLLDAHPDARRVDLAGRALLPGFVDAHNHLSIAARHPEWRDVSGVTTVDELLAAVVAQADDRPETPWIRVVGWNETVTGVVPTRSDLDALGLDRPVVVAHYSLHQAVVCSRGLAVLGIGRTTADPVGGEIGRDRTGEASGLLLERAWSEAHARSLVVERDPDRWAELVAARARVLLTEGITAVHDAACSPEAERGYRAMAAAGALPVSVLAMPHPATLFDNEIEPRLDGPPTGDGDEWFRVGPVKLFADGGVAIALDVHIGGHHVTHGITFDDVVARIELAAARGWRVGVHAIGNEGLRLALEGCERAARIRRDDDHRFRIEHVGVCDRSQVRRMAALGAVGVVQPGFVDHVGEGAAGVDFDDHAWLAFADLHDAGVTLAASSDDPCAPFPPLWGAARGATRRTATGRTFGAEQAVAFPEWLRAATAGAAYAGGQEHERGRLRPGLRADLVELDGALVADPVPTVAATWVGGRCVHATGRAAPARTGPAPERDAGAPPPRPG